MDGAQKSTLARQMTDTLLDCTVPATDPSDEAYFAERVQRQKLSQAEETRLPDPAEVTQLPEETQLPEDSDDDVETAERCNQRLEKMRAIVSKQEVIHDIVMDKVRQGEREHPYVSEDVWIASVSSPASPRSAAASQGGRHSSSPPRSPSEGYAWSLASEATTREANARIVADKIQQQHVRNQRFRKGQRRCSEQELQKNEAINASLVAMDRRFVARRAEQLQEQCQKIFRVQKRRGEQQKMLKEIQRSEERQWKLWQAKYKKEANRPSSSPVKKPVTPTAPAPAPEEENIYRETLESHEKNCDTISKWQQYVEENEQRTEAHWRKMLPGEGSAGRTRAESKEERCRSKQKAVGQCAMANRLARADSSWSVDDGAAETLRFALGAEVDIQGEAENEATSKYKRRLARCRDHQEDLFQRGQEKLSKDRQRLEAIRAKGKSKTAERAAKAESMSSAIARKTHEATTKRQMQDVSRGADYYKKQEDWAAARAEYENDRHEELEERYAHAADNRQLAMTKAQFLSEALTENRRQKLEEKDVDASENVAKKLAGYDYRSSGDRHAIECRMKLEKKRGYDEEFRKQAENAIHDKSKRLEHALGKVKKPPSTMEALQRRSSQKLERSASAGGQRSALNSSDLAASRPSSPAKPECGAFGFGFTGSLLEAQEGIEAQLFELASPTNQRSRVSIADLGRPRSSSTSQPSPAAEMSSKLSRTGSAAGTRRTLGHLSEASGGDKHPFDIVARRVSQQTNGHGGIAGGAKDPFAEDSDSGGEDGFMQDLQSRSSKWLDEAKKKTAEIGSRYG